MSKKTIDITDSQFENEVLNSDTTVLLDFWAPWCGPCKMLAPILDQLSKDYTKALIVKVNVDENPNLAAKFGIRSIPTMIIFKDGNPVETFAGVHTAQQLEQKLKSYE
ncbi:MAG: thioredoxin [Francisella sp.]